MLTIPLHPFQEQDVDWMCERGQLLLGYEMGTGKTIMCIAAIEHLFGTDEAHDALIIVPAALRWQWAAAIAKATDTGERRVRLGKTEVTVPEQRYCRVLDGTKTDWDELHDERPDYLICSYEFAARNVAEIRGLAPDIVVCDEAQMIKSASAARTKAIYKLNPHFRFALTGTPMDNGKPEEIFALMKWVDASVFGRWDLYDKAYVVRNSYGGVKEYKNLDVLNRVLLTAMARKTCEDPEVAAVMPEVRYSVRTVAMDPETRALYEMIAADLQDALAKLTDGGGSRGVDVAAVYHDKQAIDPRLGQVMARRTALRMLLAHPQLLRESASRYEAKSKKSDPGSAFCHGLDQEGLLTVGQAPKLGELYALCAQLLDLDPAVKIVVFSSYATMLPLLAAALGAFGPECYEGAMTAAARSAATARFSLDAGCRVLIATDAGGSGLDLPAARYVINYDPPQGLGRYQQRNARHRRASSAHAVVEVIDLQVARSVDVHDYEVLRSSHHTSAAAIDGKAPPAVGTRPSLRKHLATSQ